jgi:DnaK suppressor protein
MDERDREKIRARLLEERTACVERLTAFDEALRERLELGDDELSKYPLHQADDGTDTMEQEKQFLLASQEGRQLLDIDASLRMLVHNPDPFGSCERCGAEIGMDRLDIVPWARLCIDCQRQEEEGGEAGR